MSHRILLAAAALSSLAGILGCSSGEIDLASLIPTDSDSGMTTDAGAATSDPSDAAVATPTETEACQTYVKARCDHYAECMNEARDPACETAATMCPDSFFSAGSMVTVS